MAGRRISPTNPDDHRDWNALQIVSFLLDAEADRLADSGHDIEASEASQTTYGGHATVAMIMHEIAKVIRDVANVRKNWK